MAFHSVTPSRYAGKEHLIPEPTAAIKSASSEYLLCVLFRSIRFGIHGLQGFDILPEPPPSPFFDGKTTTFSFGQRHKPLRYTSLFIRLTKPEYRTAPSNKKRERDGAVGSKSKLETMKSYQILKNGAEQKLKKQKEENALGVISKSFQKNNNANCPKGSDSLLIIY